MWAPPLAHSHAELPDLRLPNQIFSKLHAARRVQEAEFHGKHGKEDEPCWNRMTKTLSALN
jgi:hypothetical protein